jgi:hypothetical protein
MSQPENDEFARIVLAEGFCTRDQVDRCRHIQSNTDERLSLGQSLLREGFMTQEQYSRVLVLLRKGYKKDRDADVARKAEQGLADGRAVARQAQEDRVLGGIVVAEGWISAGLLKVCQEEAAKSGRPLAETLVTRGHLESARVQAVLGRFERMELSCPSCRASLSVVRLPTGDPVQCPRCRNVVPPRAR